MEKIKILVTGANGFIGKNLACRLRSSNADGDGRAETFELTEFDLGTDKSVLERGARDADFVFHLAGVNRPQNESEFKSGNLGFTEEVLGLLKKYDNKCPILMTSSVQAALGNAYGASKAAAENEISEFSKKHGNKALIYRLPNVFGKWSRPNYNSAVATFCHNIARGLPITVADRDREITLSYIDDVCAEFISVLQGAARGEIRSYTKTLGEIVDLLSSFKSSRTDLTVPIQDGGFPSVLYATYLSFLPTDEFAYPLTTNADARGSFTELLKFNKSGQVSVNVGKAGVVKGNHYHHTKNEKFIVVAGSALIKFRKIGGDEIYEYFCSGDDLRVVDIPCGYTHSITAVGGDSVTLMWASEPFDQNNPDTVFEKVERE